MPDAQTLQRSRALSSAEMREIGFADARHTVASTEPRSFERGDVASVRKSNSPGAASTEPRSFERGDGKRPAGLGTSVGASTEPRSFERGDSDASLRNSAQNAASTEPRSFERGDRVSKRAARLPCWLQRSRALSSAEIVFRFQLPTCLADASTEPRSFERGDDGFVGVGCELRAASTEPRSFERGDAP